MEDQTPKKKTDQDSIDASKKEHRGVEEAIQEAMRRGEFKDLPGQGKPLDLSAYFDTPEEVRLAYTLLKDANFLPEEVEMLKEIETLKEKLASSRDNGEQQRLRKDIEARQLKFNLLMERLHKTAKWG